MSLFFRQRKQEYEERKDPPKGLWSDVPSAPTAKKPSTGAHSKTAAARVSDGNGESFCHICLSVCLWPLFIHTIELHNAMPEINFCLQFISLVSNASKSHFCFRSLPATQICCLFYWSGSRKFISKPHSVPVCVSRHNAHRNLCRKNLSR